MSPPQLCSFSAVAAHCDSLPSLRDHVSKSWAAKAVFKSHARCFIQIALKSLPLEIQQLAITIVILQQDYPNAHYTMGQFIRQHLSSQDRQLPLEIADSVMVLRELAAVFTGIENLTKGFLSSYLQALLGRREQVLTDISAQRACNSYYESEDDHVLSMIGRFATQVEGNVSSPRKIELRLEEKHRIQRALWRLHIYCMLFHRPLNAKDLQNRPSLDWESSRSLQALFLGAFVPWEVAELDEICQYLTDMILYFYENKRTFMLRMIRSDPDLWGGQWHRPKTLYDNLTPATALYSIPAVDGRDPERRLAESNLCSALKYHISLGVPFLSQVLKQLPLSTSFTTLMGHHHEHHFLSIPMQFLYEASAKEDYALFLTITVYTPEESAALGLDLEPVDRFWEIKPRRVWEDVTEAHLPNEGWVSRRHQDVFDVFSPRRPKRFKWIHGYYIFDATVQGSDYHLKDDGDACLVREKSKDLAL